MNKKIIIIVAAIIVGGVFGYMYFMRSQTPTASPFPVVGSSITLRGVANRTNTGVYLFSLPISDSGHKTFIFRKKECTPTFTHPNGETNCDVGNTFIELIEGEVRLGSVLSDFSSNVEVTGTLQYDTTGKQTKGSAVYIVVDSITVINP